MKAARLTRFLARLADGVAEDVALHDAWLTEAQAEEARVRVPGFAARYHDAICRGAQLRVDAELREERRWQEQQAHLTTRGLETTRAETEAQWRDGDRKRWHPAVYSSPHLTQRREVGTRVDYSRAEGRRA